MKTAIYLSSKNIAILSGKWEKKGKYVNVLDKVLAPMPENAVINGLIMDEERLSEGFEGAVREAKKFKSATLMLDTTHIIFRLAVLPESPARQMQGLIKNEFINRDMHDKEYIYDYSVIKAYHLPKKQQLVMCCAIDKSIVDSYTAFFSKAGIGIALEGIDFGLNALLQALSGFTDIWSGENKLICVVDHYIVSLISLQSNGDIYFYRSRIISQETDNDYYSEVGDTIYSYLQGRRSVNRDEVTKCIYIFDGNGYAPDRYERLLRNQGFENINVGLKDVISPVGLTDEDTDKYVYCLCKLQSQISSGKNLNLLKYRKESRVVKRVAAVVAGAVAFSLLLGGAAAYVVLIYSDIGKMEGEIAELEAYIASLPAAQGSGQTSSASDFLNSYLAKLDEYHEGVLNTAVLEKAVVNNAVETLGDDAIVSALSFSSEDRSVIFNVAMPKPGEISVFVGELRESGIFLDISYMGYGIGATGVDEFGDEFAWYNFTVTGYLKEAKTVE